MEPMRDEKQTRIAMQRDVQQLLAAWKQVRDPWVRYALLDLVADLAKTVQGGNPPQTE